MIVPPFRTLCRLALLAGCLGALPAASPPSPSPAPPSSSSSSLPPGTAGQAAASRGSVTGLPLPRFAVLRSDDVNLRSGPGTRYPILWVYRRRGLPVEIEREFDVWRLIKDADGIEGWVHEATLSGRRGFLVIGHEQALRAAPDDQAKVLARLAPGVIGRLRHCPQGSAWCEVEVKSYRGYLRRDGFWGTLPDEVIE